MFVKKGWLTLAALLALAGGKAQTQDTVAAAPAEFRAAWIATVDNIDWPDRGTTDPEAQKAQYLKILDMHVRNGLNAVIVQIRPAADAFYPSPYEPWSEWLTGRQGRAPVPYYDPLQFMIAAAHERKLEFHAWLNPYRAVFNLGKTITAHDHITREHPEWFLNYGDKKYFDPGNKEAQQFVVKVVRDVVKRYDLDGVHFDDYFYPYRIAGKVSPTENLRQYGADEPDDWRRSNTDSIIVL
ncbi:MAG: family 10 glycosylhydrolase [Flavihumibacter sp.]